MELLEMRWPQVDALPRSTPIVIPIAALEQHGRHMPVFTDSLLLGEVIRRVKEKLAAKVLFTPLQWLGNSHHHIDFPGTMSLSPRGYMDMLNDMAENFLFHGFQRIILINGHGGNTVPAQQAFFELRQKYRARKDLMLVSSTYWSVGETPSMPGLVQNQMGHACEWETSMMLRIRPELVSEYKHLPAVSFGIGLSPAHRAWVTKDRTEPGHIGDPAHASAEKGEYLCQFFADDVVRLLNRVLAWDGVRWDA